jgi:hypothetical protein
MDGVIAPQRQRVGESPRMAREIAVDAEQVDLLQQALELLDG